MNTKTFRGKTAKEVLARVSRELGPDADIIGQRLLKSGDGNTVVEVTAAPRNGAIPDTTTDAPRASSTPNRQRIINIVGLATLLVLFVGAVALFWPRMPEEVPKVIGEGGKPLLAVLYFENGTGDEELDKWRVNIAHLLTTDLASSKYLKVVGSPRIANILMDLGQANARSFPSVIVNKIADMANAAYIVTGRIMKADDSYRLTMQIFASATGALIATDVFEGVGEDSIFAMVDEMTVKIKENLGFDKEQIASDIDEIIEKMHARVPEAMELWKEGMRYWWNGDPGIARPMFERTIAIDPDFVMSYVVISYMYGTSGFNTESFLWAQKARKHTNFASIWERNMVNACVYFQSAKTMDKAIEAQEETLKIYRDDYWAMFLLGEFNIFLENWDKAVEYFEKAHQLLPDNKWEANLELLARTYEALGDMDKAEETFQLLTETLPEHHRPYAYRFKHYLILHDLKQAAAEAAKANEHGRRYIHFEPCLAIYRGNYAEAEHIYESYLSYESLSAQHLGRRGLVMVDVQLGQIKKALAQYQPTIEIVKQRNIQLLVTHGNFAHLHALLGDYNKAIECINKGFESLKSLSAIPQNTYSSMLLALAFKGEYQLGLHRINLALETAEELKRLTSAQHNPKLIRHYHYLMGNIALKQGEYRAAIDHFKQAYDLLSGQKYNSRCLYYLATAYLSANDLDNAEKHFREVLKYPQFSSYSTFFEPPYFSNTRPDLYAKSYYMLGKIYQARGESQKAIDNYEKFLSFWGDADPELPEPPDARKQLSLLKRDM